MVFNFCYIQNKFKALNGIIYNICKTKVDNVIVVIVILYTVF